MEFNDFKNIFKFIEAENTATELKDSEIIQVFKQYNFWLDEKDPNKSFNTGRHINNPLEKKLHDLFIKNFKDKLSYIVFGKGLNRGLGEYHNDSLSERERKIVISTIQWVASPIGKIFIKEFYDENDV